ncbi:hypothetical protein PI125_g21125 [Phytophthora idaei]|nr:hypothetical protein PI125_g21125 [Phytophthora idaei]
MVTMTSAYDAYGCKHNAHKNKPTYFGYESAASSAGADSGEKESATVSTDAAKQSKTELEVSRTPPKSRKESEESELCEKSSRRGKANQNPRGLPGLVGNHA